MSFKAYKKKRVILPIPQVGHQSPAGWEEIHHGPSVGGAWIWAQAFNSELFWLRCLIFL